MYVAVLQSTQVAYCHQPKGPVFFLHIPHNVSLAENQKGINAVQRCSINNQKGTIMALNRLYNGTIFNAESYSILIMNEKIHFKYTSVHVQKFKFLELLYFKENDLYQLTGRLFHTPPSIFQGSFLGRSGYWLYNCPP